MAKWIGAWALGASVAFAWLIGGATWGLVTNTPLPPLPFAGPLVAWFAVGAFAAMIWLALRMLRRG